MARVGTIDREGLRFVVDMLRVLHSDTPPCDAKKLTMLVVGLSGVPLNGVNAQGRSKEGLAIARLYDQHRSKTELYIVGKSLSYLQEIPGEPHDGGWQEDPPGRAHGASTTSTASTCRLPPLNDRLRDRVAL
jgi:hypothetical protein